MKKSLILLALAGSLFGQPPRPPMAAQYWWENKLAVNSLDLSEAQTKQLSVIQNSYVARLMELRSAVTKAETNLDEVFKQSPSDDLKAEAAIDQYAYARESLTRETLAGVGDRKSTRLNSSHSQISYAVFCLKKKKKKKKTKIIKKTKKK